MIVKNSSEQKDFLRFFLYIFLMQFYLIFCNIQYPVYQLYQDPWLLFLFVSIFVFFLFFFYLH